MGFKTFDSIESDISKLFEDKDKKYVEKTFGSGNINGGVFSHCEDFEFGKELFSIINSAVYEPWISVPDIELDEEYKRYEVSKTGEYFIRLKIENRPLSSDHVCYIRKPDYPPIPKDLLGLFGLCENNPRIFVDCEKIGSIKDYDRHSIYALTILHEFIHALMHVEISNELIRLSKKDAYWYLKEEALANAYALRLLKGTKYFTDAIRYVRTQGPGYQEGADIFDEGMSMADWISEKKTCSKNGWSPRMP